MHCQFLCPAHGREQRLQSPPLLHLCPLLCHTKCLLHPLSLCSCCSSQGCFILNSSRTHPSEPLPNADPQEATPNSCHSKDTNHSLSCLLPPHLAHQSLGFFFLLCTKVLLYFRFFSPHPTPAESPSRAGNTSHRLALDQGSMPFPVAHL